MISRAVKHYEHLRGRDLADFVEEDELNIDRNVDILIGTKFSWRFVTGRILQGKKPGPVTMEKKPEVRVGAVRAHRYGKS